MPLSLRLLRIGISVERVANDNVTGRDHERGDENTKAMERSVSNSRYSTSLVNVM